ncbi:MAG: Tripartite tricarboxylate transporter family receptor [Herminiimonas sp.]|nr:Tripartite tricarboxylate transporter family receptor [Herminiimonas sp.]MDB5854581.1 Tripartite tricarboxylate transporter family receptor [Herminiimonas sp.]
MDRRQFIKSGAVGATALATGLPVWAQDYPDRPIKLLQGFAPGGNADTTARLIGSEISKYLGQPVIVEAQTGAGGTLAAGAVARSKPDGYTLLLATGGHAVAAALYDNLAYKTVAGFDMVSTITYFPFLVVTSAGSKLQNFRDVLVAAKSNKEAITYGTAGIGSTHHLAGELLAKMAGINMLHVPYRGDTASMTALLSNDVSIIIVPATAVISNIKGGKLRALATTGPQRWKALPEVQTVAEQGVAGYDVRSWTGLMAPAGTARPIIDRLNSELRKALLVPALKSRLEDLVGDVQTSTPEEMKAMVSSEVARWTQVVAEAKIPKQ